MTGDDARPLPGWVTRQPVTAVFVTGMHRSGTSFAMRTLHLLGIDIGDEHDLMPPGPDNRAGYWENRLVKEYDDELLAHLGGAWDRPPVLAPGWADAPDLDPWRERAAAILDRSFATAASTGGRIGIKDPRISLLLPFWATVVPFAGSVVIVREPREVVASLEKRNGFDPTHGALLWLRYLCAACAADPGHLVLSHRAFFDDLPRTVHRLVEHFGLDEPTDEVHDAIVGHLDPELRHHVAPSGPADDHDPVLAMAIDVWNDGDPDIAALPPTIRDVLGQGWLVAPTSSSEIARARADAVDFKEQLRARNAKVRALTQRIEALTRDIEALRAADGGERPSAVATDR